MSAELVDDQHGDDERSEPKPLSGAELVAMFESSEQATFDARQKAERNRDYYDGKQLTATEVAVLNDRGQPPVVLNGIVRKVDYLKGHEAKTRTDPLALPRTPKHEDEAHAATDALRYIADKARFSQTKSKVWEDVLVEGMGGALVGVKQVKRTGEFDISIRRVPWDRLFYDPNSREQDFSDATYKGIVIWMDLEDAKRKWKADADKLSATFAASNSQTFDDRPKFKVWADSKGGRVRICEIYYRNEGVWFQAFFTQGGLLGKNEPVKYLDQDKEPECPLEIFSAYCNRDNERYGFVSQLIDLQDERNKRRSKCLHLFTMRQVQMEKGAADPNDVRTQLAKPDGVVETVPGLEFQLLETGDMATGQMELLLQTEREFEVAGPNAAMLGKDANAPSGRAILANQQGGAVELEPLLDGLRDWQRRVMTQAWNRVRQYWTGPTWVRVTDDEKNLKFVGLNQPKMQDTPYGPIQAGVENSVAELDVDISILEAPDTANIQAEQFEQLMAIGNGGTPIPLTLAIEMSSLRNKDAILEKLQGNPEEQQRQQAEEKAKGEAAFQSENDVKKSTVEKNMATAEKTRAEAAVLISDHIMPTVPTENVDSETKSSANG